ncbi:MAG TPA: AAA family ATPase [Candidatus Rubneribacter avistercoris]|nr:AAA family ATPase [Candidatus Rubneribacter avistercoris]
MRRKIDTFLDRWASAQDAGPLLVRGARRVGKTYCIKRLGTDVFGTENFAYCDFQTNLSQLNDVSEGVTDIERIVSDLSLLLRKDIAPRRTLIAFDEIQLSEKALNSLRFFAESGYRVIATGSQLGLTLRNRSLPFPNDIQHLYLRPLDFEEFLWAVGEERLANGIRERFQTLSRFPLHEEALELYHRYQIVGGMPGVVSRYAQHENFEEVRALQAEIHHTYTADIALYAPAETAVHAQTVWESIPRQLARETTRKFKYTDVAKGGRERQLRAPLAWLESAELALLNHQTNDTTAPLTARGDGSFFKVYLADTGIMFYRYNLDAETYLADATRTMLSPAFRGALAENYVMQSLVANGLETFYWTPGTTAQQEVEFVMQNRAGQIIPIEVKSGDNVRSRSLKVYLEKSSAPCAIRLSTKNFGQDGRIVSVPLYAAFCLDEEALMRVGRACEKGN